MEGLLHPSPTNPPVILSGSLTKMLMRIRMFMERSGKKKVEVILLCFANYKGEFSVFV